MKSERLSGVAIGGSNTLVLKKTMWGCNILIIKKTMCLPDTYLLVNVSNDALALDCEEHPHIVIFTASSHRFWTICFKGEPQVKGVRADNFPFIWKEDN